MGKMKELSQTLDDLRSCGEDMIRIANELTRMFSDTGTAPETSEAKEAPAPAAAEPEKPEKEAAPPDPGKKYSYEDVRGVLADLSANGNRDAARSLILKHGANKLSEINPSEYAAIIAEAEVIAHAG